MPKANSKRAKRVPASVPFRPLRDGQLITATIAFVTVPGVKEWPAATSFGAMVGLHDALRRGLRRAIGQRLDVLSSLTGAIVVIPDTASLFIHQHLNKLGIMWTQLGIPVRVGVTHGDIEILADADGMRNAIGQPLNIAARLATTSDTPGCVLHSTYLEFVQNIAEEQDFLQGARAVALVGKAHDRDKMKGRKVTSRAFPTISRLDATQLPVTRAKSVNAVAIGYDLPRFSAGDRSELSKRFRAVGDVFNSLGADGHLGPASSLYFSPGGDGGIIVLEVSKRFGHQAAERMTTQLLVESLGKDERVQVHTRVGIHYGPVNVYRNAGGVLRPTGPVCFIADAIASDQKPGGSRPSSVVFSEVFRDVVGEGNNEFFSQAFKELPPLPNGPAKGIKRFIRQPAGSTVEEEPYKQLTQKPTSWEPAP
jgi:class 3 adenylate cyclase